MNILGVRKIAAEYGITVSDFYYCPYERQWTCELDLPPGFSFSYCDYHSVPVFLDDVDSTWSKSEACEELAGVIREEGRDINPCTCGENP